MIGLPPANLSCIAVIPPFYLLQPTSSGGASYFRTEASDSPSFTSLGFTGKRAGSCASLPLILWCLQKIVTAPYSFPSESLTCRPLLLLLSQEFQKLVAVDVQEELFPARYAGASIAPPCHVSTPPLIEPDRRSYRIRTCTLAPSAHIRAALNDRQALFGRFSQGCGVRNGCGAPIRTGQVLECRCP